MKKVILALGVLLAVGAGCVSVGKLGNKGVEGDWYLAFDLPGGWVMVDMYADPLQDPVTLDYEVGREDNEIIIQNVDKPLVINSGRAPDENVPADSYIAGDGTRIYVTRLDPSRVVPSEAEDLGGGFFKVELCEDGGECQLGGRDNDDYYLVTEDAKYKFVIQSQESDDQAVGQAETIILSAEVVTVTEEDSE